MPRRPIIRRLLVVDAAVNLALGVLLLLFPLGIAGPLGVPRPESGFYPSILGGVLFGIGVALLLEASGLSTGLRGLGLAGAIAINLCGGGVLALWLVCAPPPMPLRGHLTLWAIAVAVLGVGAAEIAHRTWHYDATERKDLP